MIFSSLYKLPVLSVIIGVGTLFGGVSSAFAFSDIGGRADTASIEYLKERGVVEGYKDGSYKPMQNISRAEFTKIIVETSSIPLEKCSNTESKNIIHTFSDIPAYEWFSDTVCTAYKTGLIQGYQDGTFRPHQEINLAEASKIITLAHNVAVNQENSGEEWYTPFINSLQNEKAINSELITGADAIVNRGVMADLIWRLETGTEVYESLEPQKVESCAVLTNQIHKAYKREYGGASYKQFGREMPFDGIMETTSIESDSLDQNTAPMATPVAKTLSSDDFSTTNIQEKGVDEADIIKNDGSHIFYARGENIKIIQALPASDIQESATITVEGMNIQELMLEQDTLIALGVKTENPLLHTPSPLARIMPFPSSRIEVRIFNISDRSSPQLTRSFGIEGYLVSSRRVGETLYLVSNTSLYNTFPYQYFDTPYSQKRNEAESPASLLPKVFDNASSVSVAPECGNIFYFPNFATPSLTTLTALDISQNTPPTVSNFLGAGDLVYSSAENLYVIQHTTDQVFLNNKWQWSDISTVSKFALDGQNIEYVAQGSFPGRVLNQYSLSEFNGNLRVASTQNWGDASENMVFILDKDLSQIGSIKGIAKGEHIKSVRFMGERGFVVTFKSVDPLFVIDMDPQNPRILGELKIPGWSDYLHPLNENYLIGFGKEVNAESEHNDRLTWDMLMGMKLAIFDVSDLSNPKEIHKTIIGERGTESEILRNPKSLFFDESRSLIGFPITVYKKRITPEQCTLNEDMTCSEGCTPECEPCPSGMICPAVCKIICSPEYFSEYDMFELAFQGAHLYTYSIENGFTLQGAITHFPEGVSPSAWNADYAVSRLVRIGEHMFSLSHGIIKSLDTELQEISEISFLDEKICTEITESNTCSKRSDCEIQWITPDCPSGKLCVQKAEFAECTSK